MLRFSIILLNGYNCLYTIQMSLGILSGCVFIWSCIHTWSESKRCGRMAIDLWTVGQFAITCCSHFANMIFTVCVLLAIHTLIFYKAQSVVYILLPSQDLEAVVNRYVFIAFILKVFIDKWLVLYVQFKHGNY